MLYIESKRLGRNTVIGLLATTFVILIQGLFIAGKMIQHTDKLSESLVLFSDTQVEALSLKSMLINLRKLEKDILLYHHSPAELNRVIERWQMALTDTQQQFSIVESELLESNVQVKASIAALNVSFRTYSDGISKVAQKMAQSVDTPQTEAMNAMAVYKKHIYSMEFQIDQIVEAAEEKEVNSLVQLEQNKTALYWALGWFVFFSVLFSVLLSAWIFRKNMNISRSLEYQALHDSLTGILNRRGLVAAMRNNATGVVIAYLDLDRFKLINDLCGHTVGDELLINLSRSMNVLCKKADCTLARVGGDEFVVWQNNRYALEGMQQVSEQLVELVEEHHFQWLGQKMSLGLSVGLAVGQANFELTELISRADAACRIAKIPGNANVSNYEESDPDLLELRRQERWAAQIPNMIIENSFCLYGQKIMPLQQDTAHSHIEVLLRGLNSAGDIILPGEFLPAAERFGLMPKIDRWVIETLLDSNLDTQSHFSVNISAHTLADKAYLPELVRIVEESGKAHQLIFEITESAIMTSIETAQEYISNLKALGCRFSLDDFGSGFSSFAYLRDLKVDYLKIDGSLIKVLGHRDSDTALVQAIVSMSLSLGLKTIAEYVETPKIANILQQMQVDLGQGFGMHKPEPLDNLLFSPAKILKCS